MTEEKPQKNRKDYTRSVAAVSVCLYLPFIWLFFSDASWEYKWRFIKWIPWMPGNFIQMWSCYLLSLNSHEGGIISTVFAVALSVFLFLLLVWVGKKDWKYLVGACIVSLAIAIPASLGIYGVFKMQGNRWKKKNRDLFFGYTSIQPYFQSPGFFV